MKDLTSRIILVLVCIAAFSTADQNLSRASDESCSQRMAYGLEQAFWSIKYVSL